MYKFKLPFPPSVNTYYRRGGRVIYLSAKGRDYKKAVLATLKGLSLDGEALTGRLKVRLELSAPTKRKYDIDNRIKATLDALQSAGFIVDDEQIDVISVKRLPPGDDCCLVTVEEIGC